MARTLYNPLKKVDNQYAPNDIDRNPNATNEANALKEEENRRNRKRSVNSTNMMYMRNAEGKLVSVNPDYVTKLQSQGYTLEGDYRPTNTGATGIVQNTQDAINSQNQGQTQLQGQLQGQGQLNSGNIALIQQMFQEQKNLLIAQLRQKIAQSKSGLRTTIANAPQQFKPLKDQTELNRVRGLDTLREVIANRGDRGGVGRSEILTSDAAYGKQLSDINLAEQDVISKAKQAIEDLESQGRFEEAQIIANSSIDELRAIIEENTRLAAEAEANRRFDITTRIQQEQTDYNREQDRLRNEREQEELDWLRSPDNPNVISRDLANQIKQLEIDNYGSDDRTPDEIEEDRLKLEILRKELERITNPNASTSGSGTEKNDGSIVTSRTVAQSPDQISWDQFVEALPRIETKEKAMKLYKKLIKAGVDEYLLYEMKKLIDQKFQ